KYAIDKLAHQLIVGYLFDLGAIDAGEALTQGRRFAIRSIDWSVERDFGCRHLLRGAHDFRRLLEQAADFVFRGIALQNLGENRLGAGETDQLRILIERDADRSGLLGEGLEHRLSDPPYGVRDELHALVGIEL